MAQAASTAQVDEVVRTAIRVARLGEADMRNWWGSRGFGAAGRVVLKQRLSRTWRMAAIELDLASAANRHDEVVSRSNAVHLFSDRWPVRRWAAAWVAEQKTEIEPNGLFEQLETVTADQIEQALRSDGGAQLEPISGALRVGSIERSALSDTGAISAAVRELAAAYVGREAFVVPYIEVIG